MNKYCRRCGSKVEIETEKSICYPYYCPDCDENMFNFEVGTFEEALKEYIAFEYETSLTYPWALQPEDIYKRVEEIEVVAGSAMSDWIHVAVDQVCGVNPVLI